MKKISIFLSVLICFLGIFSPSALAQPILTNDEPPELLAPDLSTSERGPSPIYTGEFFRRDDSERYKLDGVVNTLLPGAARWITGFLAAIAVLFLIYAGILYLTAGGEEEKISEATKTAVYVVIGLVLAMFGYVLVYLFLTLFSP